jgi:hypothetical protein
VGAGTAHQEDLENVPLCGHRRDTPNKAQALPARGTLAFDIHFLRPPEE